MVDARLKSEWLNSMRFDALSDTAWRVFTSALMWSVGNGTDGIVPSRYLRLLHPDGETPEAYTELVTAGLWAQSTGGYRFLGWDGELGQSTAEQVEAYKANGRKRQQAYRERQVQKLHKVTGDVTRYVTGSDTHRVGEGEGEGKGLYGGGDSSVRFGDESGDVRVTDWTVREIPREVAS